jgi:hypothetical protein
MLFALRTAVLMCAVALGMSPAAYGQEELEAILEKWRERNAKIRKVQYDLEGKVAAAKDTMTGYLAMEGMKATGPVPPQDMVVDAPGRVLLDLDRSCARVDRRILSLNFSNGRCEPSQSSDLFDGTTHQDYYPRALNMAIGADYPEAAADIFVRQPSSLAGFFGNSELPIVMAHGLVMHRHAKRSPAAMGAPDLPPDLTIQPTDAMLNGLPHIVLRNSWVFQNAECYYDFWVDPAKDCAISRLHYVHKGGLKHAWDIDYQQVEGNWLPAKWKEVEFARNQQTINWGSVAVTHCTLRPKFEADAFHVIPRPGMIVQDDNKNTSHVVVTPRAGAAEIPVTQQWVRSRETQRWWIRAMIASVAVIAGVVGLLVFRLCTKAAARTE